MKIKFLPFINNTNGKKWREAREKAFLNGHGLVITKEINDIRTKKTSYGTDLAAYYRDLHEIKGKRQKAWLEILVNQTANLFSKELSKLSDEDKDPNKTTIVAALPEFFWYDINDNEKHNDDIVFYHKPLYLENIVNCLTEANPLSQLTVQYPNLIIFAGTAMWKKINNENHKDEEIFNSLIVYHSGEYHESITKHNVSHIDGFGSYTIDPKTHKKVYNEVKHKAGESTFNIPPIITFNNLKFTVDICLDFVRGKYGTSAGKEIPVPLSRQLCKDEHIDVNVLIAAGMPIDSNTIPYLSEINSPVLLRCDGLGLTHGEIIRRAGGSRVKCDESKIIDCVEVNI